MPQIFHRSANTLAKVSIAGVLLLAGGLIGLIMILARSHRPPARASHQGFTRLTIRGRSHTLPRHVASEAEHERVQAPCSRDFQLLAAKQV